MSKMTVSAYGSAIRAVVECCNKDNGGNILNTLKGLVVDWSSAQISRIKFAFSEEKGKQLLCGCQVCSTLIKYLNFVWEKHPSSYSYIVQFLTGV